MSMMVIALRRKENCPAPVHLLTLSVNTCEATGDLESPLTIGDCIHIPMILSIARHIGNWRGSTAFSKESRRCSFGFGMGKSYPATLGMSRQPPSCLESREEKSLATLITTGLTRTKKTLSIWMLRMGCLLSCPMLPKSREEAVYRLDSIQYILRSSLSKNKKLLVIAIYEREASANGFSKPCGVLYLEKDCYLTCWDDGQEHWKESRISYAMNCMGSKESICLTTQDEKRILSFLEKWDPDARRYTQKTERDIVWKIEEYQTHILEQRLKAKKKKRAEHIDRRMNEVPPLPAAFQGWLTEGPLLNSRNIFYRRTSHKIARCFCTHCESYFHVVEDKFSLFPAHNKSGFCPACHSKITYKSWGRTSCIYDSADAAIFQKSRKGELLLRYFSTRWEYHRLGEQREISFHERARLFFDFSGQITGQYKYGHSSQTDRYGWYVTRDHITGDPKYIDYRINLGMYRTVINVWFEERHLYPYNLHTMLKEANLSYDLKRYLHGAVDVTSYLFRGKQYPYAPSLYRIGMEKAAKDILENYYSPVTSDLPGPLHKKFGISKDALGWIKENGLGMEEINLLAAVGEKTTQKDYHWAVANQLVAEHVAYLRKFVSFPKMRNYLSKQVKREDSNEVRHNCNSIKDSAQRWKDYLQMCENLGYDMEQERILFPKNLRDEHDKVVQLTRVRFDAEMDRKIQKIYPSLNQNYSYTDGIYLICPPKNFQEFVDEGVNLLHCVCTNRYYIKHVEGNNLIFFVRKNEKPDEPFCTMEYDVAKNKVLQLYGFRDQTPAKDVQDFVDSWRSLRRRKTQCAA